MSELNSGQRDLVALGAALGSNCVPCVERYVSEARKTGLSDRQIEDAIRLADSVRRVPAQKVLDAALALLSKSVGPETDSTGTAAQPACADRKGSCCQRPDGYGDSAEVIGTVQTSRKEITCNRN